MLTRNLILLLDKIQNELMIPNKELSYACAAGVNGVAYGCSTSCSGDCEDSCRGSCDGSCSGSCNDSCDGDCQWGID